jgi:septum formation protein
MLRLASRSAARARLLTQAGVFFEPVDVALDEESAKAALLAEGLGARDLADALAELKALRGAAAAPADLVLGCDQTLELDDGSLISKATSREDAACILAMLAGRTHKLHAAAVLVESGRPVWRHVESVSLHVRSLTPTFISDYLNSEWEQVRHCVGCYRIEGPGVQLMARISGSLFAVQGLPLLPLLDVLRQRTMLPA